MCVHGQLLVLLLYGWVPIQRRPFQRDAIEAMRRNGGYYQLLKIIFALFDPSPSTPWIN